MSDDEEISVEEFELTNAEYIPLDKLLKATGIADTGGMARVAITEGLVRVDGEIELRKRAKIRKGQVVQLDEAWVKVV